MQSNSKARWAALLLVTAMVPASATFHLMKIVELFPGTASAPDAHYVVLQMYAGGQNLVADHRVTIHDASGGVVQTLVFSGDVGNGANQARILLATPQAEAFFGVDADLSMGATLLRGGGKACFEDIDCVAWGAYSGSAAGVGTPFNAPAGLQSGRATVRRLDISGSPVTLESGDDTGNSATDFVFGAPAPRNNAGMLGAVPGATCGNGALEGLEQCDDGNQSSGDGCSNTCVVDEDVSALPRVSMAGDFNGDGRADVFWRNGRNGANVIWLSANKSTALAVASVTDVHWVVAGIGRFDAGNRSDVLWRNLATGVNAIWRSGNKASPQSVAAMNTAWQVVGIGDFDGNGRSDVLWRNLDTGANTIWRSASQQSPQVVASVTNLDWQVVAVGDYNGDGRSDVMWRNRSSGDNAIWLSANKATPLVVASVTNLSWQVAGSGDVNGDGKADLVWRDGTSGANVIWRSANKGSPLAMSGVTNVEWELVQVGDFGNNARDDVFWRNGVTGANAIWGSASAANYQGVASVTNVDWKVAPLRE